MDFLFSSIPKFLDQELEARRGNRLEFQRPKSTWMRMTSGYYVGDPSDRKVLMGGVTDAGGNLPQGFAGMYESGAGEVRRPVPTIESITVDERFEHVESEVSWKVFSRSQLQDLFPYFMNLGSTVFLDFGWSKVPRGSIIDVADTGTLVELWKSFDEGVGETTVEPADPSLSPGNRGPYDYPKFEVLKNGEGRYNVVKGIITDFSYNPEGEGVFSCSTSVQSASKAMASVRSTGQINRREVQDTPKKSLDEYLEQDFIDDLSDAAADSSNTDVVAYESEAEGGFLGLGSLFGSGDDVSRTDVGDDSRAFFVSFKYIEQVLLPHLKTEAESGASTFEFNSSRSLCGNFRQGENWLRSTDPFVCLVNSTGDTGDIRKLSQNPFDGDSPYETPPMEGKDQNRRGYIYNIYPHYELIIQAFIEKPTVPEAIEWMMGLCSEACFDIWDFEIVDDANSYKVVDKNSAMNSVEDSQGHQAFTFRLDTDDTIVRDHSFNTNLDDIIKSQLVAQKYSDLEGDPAINDRNDSTTKLFGGLPGKDLILSGGDKADESRGDQVQGNAARQTNDGQSDPEEEERQGSVISDEEQLESLTQVIGDGTGEGLLFSGTKEEGNRAALELSAALQADDSPDSPVNGGNIVNIDVTLTLDGVSGFCTYQVLNIEGVPQIFRDKGVFFVEKVSHSIDGSDWTTEVQCQLATANLV